MSLVLSFKRAAIIVCVSAALSIPTTNSLAAGLIKKTSECCGIKITGTQVFIERVESALRLLEKKSPKEFSLIRQRIGIIEENQRSGMVVDNNPPKFQLSIKSALYSVTWCAGAIAHDAYHSELYSKKQNWADKSAEVKCMEFQLKVMRNIKAPEKEIKYLKSLDGSHADVDKDGDYDWDDYRKRNW